MIFFHLINVQVKIQVFSSFNRTEVMYRFPIITLKYCSEIFSNKDSDQKY